MHWQFSEMQHVRLLHYCVALSVRRTSGAEKRRTELDHEGGIGEMRGEGKTPEVDDGGPIAELEDKVSPVELQADWHGHEAAALPT